MGGEWFYPSSAIIGFFTRGDRLGVIGLIGGWGDPLIYVVGRYLLYCSGN